MIWHLPGINHHRDHLTLCNRLSTGRLYYNQDNERDSDHYCQSCLDAIEPARAAIRRTEGPNLARNYNPLWKHHNLVKLSRKVGHAA